LLKKSLPDSKIVQGQSWQTGFFKLALTDRNMHVRFFFEGAPSTTQFAKMQTCFWKKDLKCNYCKAISFKKINGF
jgi:hypothetical protein